MRGFEGLVGVHDGHERAAIAKARAEAVKRYLVEAARSRRRRPRALRSRFTAGAE
jgi:hypothetical protein